MDINKTYRTRSGKAVVGLIRVSHNSAGRVVTFPIKGTIIDRDRPRKNRYAIWTEMGASSIFGDHRDDLVEVSGP